MSSKTDRELLEELNRKMDLLLDQKGVASEKHNDELQGPEKKAPRKRQAQVKPIDFKTMYRRKGIC